MAVYYRCWDDWSKRKCYWIKKRNCTKTFVEGAYAKYECSTNEAIFNSIIVDIDENTKSAIKSKSEYVTCIDFV